MTNYLTPEERKELQRFKESSNGILGVDFKKDRARQKVWFSLAEKNLIKPYTAHEDFVYYESNLTRPEVKQERPF